MNTLQVTNESFVLVQDALSISGMTSYQMWMDLTVTGSWRCLTSPPHPPAHNHSPFPCGDRGPGLGVVTLGPFPL